MTNAQLTIEKLNHNDDCDDYDGGGDTGGAW